MPRIPSFLALAATVLALPGAALAHVGAAAGPGPGQALLSGLAHPIGGADHLLAMVAVGLWAALIGGRALWALPLAFVGAMFAGGLAGAAGLILPGVEPMILASVVVLGAAVGLALRPGPLHAAAAVALFGLVHGQAHGVEAPATGMAGYAAGFALATMALHVAGIGLGRALMRAAGPVLPRGAGAATALAGMALVVAG